MKKGYTLVEVMLGLSILGIISTMVIPVFYNNYANKIKGTQLKKICAQISNATESIISDENAQEALVFPTEAEAEAITTRGFYLTSAGVKTSNETQGAEYFLNQYFKHVKVNCGPGGSADCVSANYKSANGDDLGAIPNGYYCIKSANMAAICMKYDNTLNTMRVIVDVNGTEKPNMTGSDLFIMSINSDGHLQDADESNCNKSTNNATIENTASGCFTKIVANGWQIAK